MNAATAVSVEEYLRTCYRPDREFLEGTLLDRNVGQYDHSTCQTILAGLFNARVQEWGFRARVELRVQVRRERFRVPDVCVLSTGAPREQIITTAPLLCIEVLSETDRMSEMQERIDDYLQFGVPCVWLLDPRQRTAWVHTNAGARQVRDGVLRVDGTPIAVPLTAVFQDLID